MKASIVAFFFCICNTASAFWLLDTSKPRDCLWTYWSSSRRCERFGPPGSHVYLYKKKRHMIPAINGGKNCTGLSEDYVACDELEYLATTFLKSVTYATPENGKSAASPKDKLPDGGDECTMDHKDREGNVRMIGRSCPLHKPKSKATAPDGGLSNTGNRAKRNVDGTKNRDVLFVMDESRSDNTRFPKFLRLAKSVMNSLCGSSRIGKDTTRVGVVTFDRVQHVLLDFDQHFVRADILNYLDDAYNYTEDTSNQTCLLDALSYTREEMFTKRRGARVGDANTEKVVILMTDGCKNCQDQGDLPTALIQMREQFAEEKIPIITFVVSNDEQCVRTMSNLADGSQCYQAFRAMNFAELDEITDAIEMGGCVDGWQQAPSCQA